MVEVEIVARIRMQVWHERFGIFVECPCRFFEDALTLPVADNIV